MHSADSGRDPTPGTDADRSTVRVVLVGSDRIETRWRWIVGLALGLFVVTFTAYELRVFTSSGGVVFIPFYAGTIGILTAFWVGYSRNGLLPGWALTSATLLGWHTEWATNISPRPLVDRIAYVVQPSGLAYLAVVGLILSVFGFSAGAIVRWSVETLRSGQRARTDD